MDDLFLQNALSRSLGLDVGGESVGLVSVTSRGSTGSCTLREDVHHLFIELDTLPVHWVDNLQYQLSKHQVQELKLLEFGNEAEANAAYVHFCRNLNLSLASTNAEAIKFNCVEIIVDDKHRTIIVLRDREGIAG